MVIIKDVEDTGRCGCRWFVRTVQVVEICRTKMHVVIAASLDIVMVPAVGEHQRLCCWQNLVGGWFKAV